MLLDLTPIHTRSRKLVGGGATMDVAIGSIVATQGSALPRWGDDDAIPPIDGMPPIISIAGNADAAHNEQAPLTLTHFF